MEKIKKIAQEDEQSVFNAIYTDITRDNPLNGISIMRSLQRRCSELFKNIEKYKKVKLNIYREEKKGFEKALKVTNNHSSKHPKPNPKQTDHKSVCQGCGYFTDFFGASWLNHSQSNCPYSDHPDYNGDNNTSWKNSVYGKEAKKKGFRTINRRSSHIGPYNKKPVIKTFFDNKPKKGIEIINASYSDENINLLLHVMAQDNSSPIEASVLVDSGAEQGSYMSPKLASVLKEAGANTSPFNVPVRSGLDSNNKQVVKEIINFYLTIYNEITNCNETILSQARITNIEKYDLLIGKPDISKH